jgi:hypothetical protein
MYDNPYDRKFGIEFEFAMPIRSDLSRWSSTRTNAFRNLLTENGLADFNIGHDGSEWEVRTPPLSGPNGFKRVKRFLEVILENGGYVTGADGLHVHHDAPEFIGNTPLTVKLVESWLRNQNEIMKMVHSRRNNSSACPIWNWEAIDNLKIERISERRNLNVRALQEHGTIEVRLHEGTLDYEEVFSWVRFGQAFIGNAVKEAGDELLLSYVPKELMKRVNLSRNAARFLVKKMEKYQNPVLA